MSEPKQHHYWRWASLAAAIILLALCLILLGGHVTAAEVPSHPSTSEVLEVVRGKQPPAPYPWERSTFQTNDPLSPQQDEFDLGVSTWTIQGYARPGGVYVYGIYYGNHPDAIVSAENVSIIDTLPAGTTYLGDTSGRAASYDESAGTVTWDLGTVNPGDYDAFMVTVGIPLGTPEGSGVINSNHVAIQTTTAGDWDPENDEWSSDLADVWADGVEVEVQKRPEPGDPAPGQEFQYAIEWCNNRGAAVGPVMLTDTLPVDTHFVRWEPRQWWQQFWTEVTANDDELVLEAPGLPGDWCQEILVVLEVEPSVEISNTLGNLVVISAEGDVDPENDVHFNTEAHVSEPRFDLAVQKWFNSGVLAPGGWIEYGISYWNQGNTAVEAQLLDTLPEDAEYIPGSAWKSGESFEPGTVTPDLLEWNVSSIGVNQGEDFSFQVAIDAAAEPGITTNCVLISPGLEEEDTPEDNEWCTDVQIFEAGPNLHVEKWSQWNQEEIYYNISVANWGTELVPSVLVTDTYPIGTTSFPWEHWPSMSENLSVTVTSNYTENQWLFLIEELGPSETGWLDFYVTVEEPQARPRWYTNTVEIGAIGFDPEADDANPADNVDTDVIVKPELDSVNLWLEPDGSSGMWGEGEAGAVVTVTVTTLPPRIYTTTVGTDECTTCWGIDYTGIIEPGDVILVEVGDALMPVLVEVPDPFTANLDREARTVSGEIGGWLNEPVEVRGWWDGGWQQQMTDGAGYYEAVYEDPIPPGAQGAVYFETQVDYTQVSYYRHFRDMSLILQVNYDHDWIQGEYEIGHTVWLTVEKPAEFSPVYTVTLTTQEGVGEYGGFYSDWGDWHPERPNLEPGDEVFGRVETGYEAGLKIGTITGWIDPDADRIDGEVHADWLDTETVDVECHPWGAPEGTPNKWFYGAGTAGDPPYFCQWEPDEWDVLPGQDIAVSYYEPAGHQVFGVFSTPWMRVNYGHDWVGGNYPLEATFTITVTESDGETVKGIAVVETSSNGGWGGPGFETQDDSWIGQRPDIIPGDYVYFAAADYDHVVQVGTIEGTINLSADSISGPIFVPWFDIEPDDELDVECHPWGGPEYLQPKSSTAGPDGWPEYECAWSSDGWDILPGQEIGVMYIEPDDADRVMNAFHEPAPDMSVDKGPEGTDQFAPGGRAVFWINYHNDGDADATSVVLTDTLPSGVTFVGDTSGFAHNYDPTGGTVVWDLGAVALGEGGQFQLVVQIPPDFGSELVNEVEIDADFDPNEDNNYAAATIYRNDAGSALLNVGKNPSPGDPTPGSTFVYDIYYGNDGPVPSGPATLTDILPVCTSVVDWYSQNGYDFWTEVSRDPNLILEAPTLPGGGWGDSIILRLRVADGCALNTQLENEVVLEAPPADPVSQTNSVAWTREPNWNAHLQKNFGWGMLVPGGEIGYNLHVANHGNMTTTIWLTDTLPAGTTFVESWMSDGRDYVEREPYLDDGTATWDLGEIPPGAWLNIDLRLDIDPVLAYDTTLTNCAEIMVAEGDGWPYDNEACRTDAIREEGPNLRIYKEYQWNWEGQIHYEIYFQNVGTETLNDVWILDELPPGTSFDGVSWGSDFWRDIDYDPLGETPRWIIPEFQPGWSSRVWFDVDLDSELIGEEGLSYPNLVEAPVEGDKWPGDNISEVTAYTGPDLFVEKWLSDGEPRPGELVTFTVVFGNRNQWPWGTDEDPPEPATSIIDTLPDELTFMSATAPWDADEAWWPEEDGNILTWDWGRMDPGSWWTFDFVAEVSETAVEDEVIVNTIEVVNHSEDDTDPLMGNNTDELEITILPPYHYIYLPVILRNY